MTTGDEAGSSAVEDQRAVATYRERYGAGPFLAADAVVTTGDGKILLIRRSRAPGRGLLALPGGFVDPNETFLAAALRELREETGLDLAMPATPPPMRLRDRPDRDPRARIVSVAYHLILPDVAGHHDIAAGDDAADARWHDIEALPGADGFFADHHETLSDFGLAVV